LGCLTLKQGYPEGGGLNHSGAVVGGGSQGVERSLGIAYKQLESKGPCGEGGNMGICTTFGGSCKMLQAIRPDVLAASKGVKGTK